MDSLNWHPGDTELFGLAVPALPALTWPTDSRTPAAVGPTAPPTVPTTTRCSTPPVRQRCPPASRFALHNTAARGRLTALAAVKSGPTLAVSPPLQLLQDHCAHATSHSPTPTTAQTEHAAALTPLTTGPATTPSTRHPRSHPWQLADSRAWERPTARASATAWGAVRCGLAVEASPPPLLPVALLSPLRLAQPGRRC